MRIYINYEDVICFSVFRSSTEDFYLTNEFDVSTTDAYYPKIPRSKQNIVFQLLRRR